MARKKHKRKQAGQLKLANPEWARFCTAYHGRGAHKDQSAYRRKSKHATDYGDHYDGTDNG
jgi:hypothetical protein